MKLIVVAGTPGSGKTAVLVHALRILGEAGKNCSVAKVDCLYTDDDKRFSKLGIPVMVGLSKDMCPDHFAIYNLNEMLEWAEENQSDFLILETAGLCHRCAPYSQECLGVCVADATAGPNTPLKLGPFLSTADFVIVTKGDMISQAEREIFREKILEVNPKCAIIEANGLSGQGCAACSEAMMKARDLSNGEDKLRHSAPLAICTLCVGETRIKKEFHRGVLRRIDGFQTYVGE
ncbi:MAG: hypothetical protein GX417_05715 [Clostridiales bacterium]|nr:hypothetical protein [Clostridiales bacterium]